MSSFWRVFHNLLRHTDDHQEIERATATCMWMAENFLALRQVCKSEEIELLSRVHKFWFDHRTAPSLSILIETMDREKIPEKVKDLVSQYQEYIEEEEIPLYSIPDLDQVLADLVEEWESARLSMVLNRVQQINVNKWQDPKTKEFHSGSNSAIRYLFKQVEAGKILTASRAASGSMNETARELHKLYDKYKAEQQMGNLIVKCGIAEIDDHVAIKRGDFVGVLGYSGSRKSTLCRSMAYNAARQGFNVLHVTLEQTYDEERIFYGMIHASVPNPKFGTMKDGSPWKLSKARFESGGFSKEEEEFFRDLVLPDFDNLPGKLIIKQPMTGSSWPSIKSLAEITSQTVDLDLFYLDYLAMCATSTRDPKQEIEAYIKDAKQTALRFGGGRGVVFLTPIQGNRKGRDEARENEGVWDITGVYEYSEFDKSCDTIFSVFTAENDAKDQDRFGPDDLAISSVKIRRAKQLGRFIAAVDSEVGYVASRAKPKAVSDEEIAIELAGDMPEFL